MITLNSFSLYKVKDVIKIVCAMNSPWYELGMLIFAKLFSGFENLNSRNSIESRSALRMQIPRKITVGVVQSVNVADGRGVAKYSSHGVGESQSQVPGRAVHLS